MAGRWFVHRNDQQLGPFRADEIRQGLRDGQFDPFDLISREGSHVRVELMEIDEIFVHSQIEYMPVEAEQPLEEAAGGGGGAFIGGAAAEVNPQQRSGMAPLNGPAEARGGSASGAAKRSPNKRGKSESPKRFFLVESNGRIIGPMAASEIQAAWAGGGLDKSLMVQKNNSPAKVPIAKFVHLYTLAKNAGPQEAAAPVTSPLLSHMIRAEADRRGRLRRWLVPALGLLVFGLALAVAYVYLLPSRSEREPAPRRTPAVPAANKPTLKPVTQPVANPAGQPKAPVVKPAPRTKAFKLPPPSTLGSVGGNPRKVQPPPPRVQPRPVRIQPQPVKVQPQPARVQPQPVKVQPQPVKVQPQPVKVQPQPVKVQPQPVKAQPQAPAAPSAGGDIVGATFNMADLTACAMKCKIKFTARGEQITVVFFKGAFEDQLKAKRGPVTLSGRLSQDAGGGKTMYLQAIK